MADNKNPEKPVYSPDDNRIPWHSAFFEAIQLELEEYSGSLEFISEYPLTTEPLRIDVVIIKKSGDVPIEKNIAAIFRKVNILEYKSPDDYVSVWDFYMVYGYACLYVTLNKVSITDLTLTFVESRYPRKLLTHLREVRKYTVEEKQPGIYTVKGDILPMQIIDSRKLSAEENLWLKDLDNELETGEIRRITTEIERQGKAARIRAYLDVITKANKEKLQEALEMRNTTLTVREIFRKAGILDELIAESEERKATEIAENMLRNGFSVEQTAQLSGLDTAKVRELAVS